MANVSGQGTIWNLPNYAGQLFTAAAEQTPLLGMLGGLAAGVQTDNFEFPVSSIYDYPAAAQPAITETASAGAGTGYEYERTQTKNVTQIFQEYVDITYVKLSNAGRLSGLNTQGQVNNASNELAFQIDITLKKIARDVEFTLINGVYQISTAANVANKTRGLLAIAATEIAASAATLTLVMLKALFKGMADAGAYFDTMVLVVNSFQKQKLSDIYNAQTAAQLPPTRNIGGFDLQEIIFDFGKAYIVFDKFIPADDILLVDLAVVRLVFQPVPEKGNFFLEDQAKAGAGIKKMIFGQLGLDHGPGFMHGKITNLAVA